jgi:hypothetical protein
MDCDYGIVRDRVYRRNTIASVIFAFLRYPNRYSIGGESGPLRRPA